MSWSAALRRGTRREGPALVTPRHESQISNSLISSSKDSDQVYIHHHAPMTQEASSMLSKSSAAASQGRGSVFSSQPMHLLHLHILARARIPPRSAQGIRPEPAKTVCPAWRSGSGPSALHCERRKSPTGEPKTPWLSAEHTRSGRAGRRQDLLPASATGRG